MYHDFKYEHISMKNKSYLTFFLAIIYDQTKNITQAQHSNVGFLRYGKSMIICFDACCFCLIMKDAQHIFASAENNVF